MIFALLAVTRIVHVSIGYSDTTESAINKVIERLEQTIDDEHQTLEIKKGMLIDRFQMIQELRTWLVLLSMPLMGLTYHQWII